MQEPIGATDEAPPTNDAFWVIGIGASAGGLEALSSFFRAIPRDSKSACFLIAQHLSPHSKSMMVELLGRQSDLPVESVQDHMALEPGKIFIVPPNFDLSIFNGELRLTEAGVETRPKPSVDTFFASLAKAFKRRAVGIILSGTGSDGALGVREIKAFGGAVFVQDSESAKYDGMPKSAFDTGLVDAVLPVEKLGAQLFTILENPHNDSANAAQSTGDTGFAPIISKLREVTGLDFREYKSSTVFRRIEKRMGALNIANAGDYLERLRTDSSEAAALSQELLISVTSFFRDPDHFQSLRSQCEAQLQTSVYEKEYRIWVAGCATGEEAFSLLMVLDDLIFRSGRHNELSVKVFATDLDQAALAVARAARYPIKALDQIPQEFVEKYIDLQGEWFEIKRRYRDQVVFARQDLVQNPPFVRVDLVSCRNVLIYFDTALQEKVLSVFQYALKPEGLLFLGKSEAVNADTFVTLDKKHKIFRRSHVQARALPNLSSRYTVRNSTYREVPAAKTNEAFEIGLRRILKASGFAGAVIDESGAVQHFIGDVGRYIELPEGKPDYRLANLLGARGGVELSILIKKAAFAEKAESRVHACRDSTDQRFSFSVELMDAVAGYSGKSFLVTFVPRAKVAKLKRNSGEEKPLVVPSGKPSVKILELEQEIAATREHLQTVIEELEVSNEELQSVNEEMSSTNEELQAANEELETTNEEMQSTNEELTTLNEELSTKSAELRAANLNLENVQTSIGAPLVVVDSELRLLRYNSVANQIFTIGAGDLSRSILQISCQCEIPNFEVLLRGAVDTGLTQEGVCSGTSRIFQMRVHPFRDEHKKITGAVLFFFDNTEAINAQEKLQASDSRIRAIINGSPTIISLKDTSGKYLTVNRSFLNQFRMSEDRIIGKTDREIFDSATATAFHDRDLEVILRRTPTEAEERLIIDGMERFFLSSRFALVSDADGTPFAVGTVSLDITAQITAQEELRQSQARYRAIVEDQAVFVARLTPEGTLTFVNLAFCSYFGGSPDSNVARTFLSVIDRRDQKKFSTELELLSMDVPIVQVELRVNPASTGPIRWVRWILRGIFDGSGQIHEYQAVGFDVTEVHNRTADLLEKENLFTHVLEHTSDYLSVFKHENGEFILESFNQSAGLTKGLGQGRFVGQSLEDFLDPARADYVLRRYRESLLSRSAVTFEEVVEAPGGLRHLSTTLVPVHDSSEKTDKIVALSRDITRLKRVETALRAEKEKADLANRTKSDFLASMSHELRTPLNVITGMSQLLAMAKLPENQAKFVSSIQRSSKALLSLIEDVLDLSKIEAGKVTLDAKPISIYDLTSELAQSYEIQAKQRGNTLHFETNLDPKMHFMGDATRIRQIISNLLSNAVKFTHEGTISLKVNDRREGTGSEHVLHVEVTDSGIGVPEESLSKLFQRFSQVDSGIARKYGGTGLGLVISKQIVELMGGTIGVESAPEKGSCFWFTLHLSEVDRGLPAATSSTPPTNSQNLDFAHLVVLAVDDNPDNLSALTMYLEDRGAKVLTTDNGEDAIRLVDSEPVHIVLMDVQMPGMDGLETTRRIRSLHSIKSDIPIVAVTANAMSEDPVRCREAGMDDYLSKPVNFDALSNVIASHAKWGKRNLALAGTNENNADLSEDSSS